MEEAATIGTAAAGAPADVSVRLDGVTKLFGGFAAIDDVDLDVARGEFFSLLGPSGSGKTTCLRMIAGFERPTRGRIFLSGSDVVATTLISEPLPRVRRPVQIQIGMAVLPPAALVLLSIIPVYFAQRLTSGVGATSSRAPAS